MDVSVEFMGLKFKNPLWAASGTVSLESAELQKLNSYGAVVLKTVTPKPRSGNNPPRLFEVKCGVINSIGIPNPGFDKWCRENLSKLTILETRVGFSMGGESPDDYKVMAELVRKHLQTRIDFVEVNVSCPNVESGKTLEDAPETLREILPFIRKKVDVPLVVKFGIANRYLLEEIEISEKSGFDAVSIANTIPAVAVDLGNLRFAFDKVFAGLSGPAVKPIALASVVKAVRCCSLPVVGGGGVSSGLDAVEFLLVGARAVQVGLANLTTPGSVDKMLKEMSEFLKRNRFESVESAVGYLLEKTSR